jgi:hypothetical protein
VRGIHKEGIFPLGLRQLPLLEHSWPNSCKELASIPARQLGKMVLIALLAKLTVLPYLCASKIVFALVKQKQTLREPVGL